MLEIVRYVDKDTGELANPQVLGTCDDEYPKKQAIADSAAEFFSLKTQFMVGPGGEAAIKMQPKTFRWIKDYDRAGTPALWVHCSKRSYMFTCRKKFS